MDPTPPLHPLVEKFLEDIAVPKTRAAYRTGAGVFLAFIGDRAFPDGLTDDTLVEFWRWLRKRKPAGQWQKDSKKLSDQTIRAYLDAAVAFLLFLSDERALPTDFSIERAKHRLRRKRTGTQEGTQAPYPTRIPDPRLPLVVLHYDRLDLPPAVKPADKRQRLILLRNRAIVHVLYSTAGRLSEVARLDRADVGEGLAEQAIVTGKGNKQRTLFFTQEARAAIRAYLKERTDSDKALFVGHRSAGKLGARSLWRAVKDAAQAEGLPDIHPHDFRHLRASQLLSEGARLEEVQEILGHSDIGTTRKIYAAFSQATVKEAFKAYTLKPEEALVKAESEGASTASR